MRLTINENALKISEVMTRTANPSIDTELDKHRQVPTCSDEFGNLSFADDGVTNVESSVLPLHRTVGIDSVAQPEKQVICCKLKLSQEAAGAVAQLVKRSELRSLKEEQLSRREFYSHLRHRNSNV